MSSLSYEEKLHILKELHIPHKRFLIQQVLAIKRDHPELTDEQLLADVFPPYQEMQMHIVKQGAHAIQGLREPEKVLRR
jgi:hypothetical protein